MNEEMVPAIELLTVKWWATTDDVSVVQQEVFAEARTKGRGYTEEGASMYCL